MIFKESDAKINKAIYHLPGLFEFYELYSFFLPLFFNHREYFYDWCEIGSIYGAPADCIWGGGRVGFGDAEQDKVLELLGKYGISARLTFSNSLLRAEHLSDKRCNRICKAFEKGGTANQGIKNGIIVHSDLLLDYLKHTYPGFYFVSSTTKVITDFSKMREELNREDFSFVVPDFRINNNFQLLNALSEQERCRVEFLCNECCFYGCKDRADCYESVSRKCIGEDFTEHICNSPGSREGYKFSLAKKNPGFIGIEAIKEKYLPLGFSNFKIEGRGLGSAIVLEFLLYYLTKPEYQLEVREAIYLDSMLDLF